MKPDHLFHDDAEYEDDDNAEWIRMMGNWNIYVVYFTLLFIYKCIIYYNIMYAIYRPVNSIHYLHPFLHPFVIPSTLETSQ